MHTKPELQKLSSQYDRVTTTKLLCLLLSGPNRLTTDEDHTCNVMWFLTN